MQNIINEHGIICRLDLRDRSNEFAYFSAGLVFDLDQTEELQNCILTDPGISHVTDQDAMFVDTVNLCVSHIMLKIKTWNNFEERNKVQHLTQNLGNDNVSWAERTVCIRVIP